MAAKKFSKLGVGAALALLAMSAAQAEVLSLGDWSNGKAGSSTLTITGANGDADDQNTFAYRSLTNAYSGAEVFLRATFSVAAGSALAANDFVALWLDNSASGAHTSVPNFGIKSDLSNGNDVFVRSTGTGGSAVANSNLLGGQSFTVLARLYKTVATGNYNRIALWFNPTASDSLTTADASFAGDSGLSSFKLVGIRNANLDAGDVVGVSNVGVATSFVELAPVPEPSSSAMLLAGLGMMGLIARRRLGA